MDGLPQGPVVTEGELILSGKSGGEKSGVRKKMEKKQRCEQADAFEVREVVREKKKKGICAMGPWALKTKN